MFVRQRGIEIHARRRRLLDRAHEPIEPSESIQSIRVANPRTLKAVAEHRNRLVVRLQGHGKRVAVLATMRE